MNSKSKFAIANLSQGISVVHLYSSQLKLLSINLPAISEQHKIASFLSLLNERISTQSKILLQYQSLIKNIRDNLFSQNLRFKNEINRNFLVWKNKKLGDCGYFFSGGTPLTSKSHYFRGTIPFIRSGEINSNYTEQFISNEGLMNSSAKLIEVGDLIYALYGATSGEVGISKINGAINQAVLCLRTELHNFFLYSFLKFKKEFILKTYLQGGQGNLSAEIIKSLIIPVPEIDEQVKIASFLSLVEAKIETEKSILEQLELQKKYLLQQMFV